MTALFAAFGGAAIYLAALPALWRTSWPFGLVFTALGAAQLVLGVAVVRRPMPRRVFLAAAAAFAVVCLWALTRLTTVQPDPWTPVDSVIGFTDYVCAALQGIAVLGLAGVAAFGIRPRPARWRRVLAAAAIAPLTLAVLVGTGVGLAGASDGLAGAGFPGAAGVTTTLIEVHGTGHTLDTPGQRPSPEQLIGTFIGFFSRTLSSTT